MLAKRECGHIAEDLWNYAVDGLPEADRKHVAQHLVRCTDCQKQAQEYWETAALMAEYKAKPLPHSETGWQELSARLDAVNLPRKQPTSSRMPIFAGAFAASMILLTGALLLAKLQSRAGHAEPNIQQIARNPLQGVPDRHNTPLITTTVKKSAKAAKPDKKTTQPVVTGSERNTQAQAKPRKDTHPYIAPRFPRHAPLRAFADSRSGDAETDKNQATIARAVFSVDGDRPTDRELPRRFVLDSLTASETRQPARRYVLGKIMNVDARPIQAAFHPESSESEEMQAW